MMERKWMKQETAQADQLGVKKRYKIYLNEKRKFVI